MNRQDRRKNKIDKSSKTLNVSENYLNDLVKKTRLETIELLTAVFSKSLNNEFNFGTKRINKVLKSANIEIENINAGKKTFEDLLKWCKDNNIKL